MNFLLFLAISIWPIARGIVLIESPLLRNNSDTIINAVAAMSRRQISLSIELYKAFAKVETESFGLSTADAFAGLSRLIYGAGGNSLVQLSNVLGFSPKNSAARLALQDLVRTFNNLQYHGAWINSAIFHAYETKINDRLSKNMEMIFGSGPQKYPSWDEITSGRAFYEWSEEMGLTYPHNQYFKMDKSLVLASASVFSSRFHVVESKICYVDSIFNDNDRDSSENHERVRITDEFNYGEFNYRPRYFNDRGDATARYIKLTWRTKPEEGEIKTIIILPDGKYGIDALEENIDENTMREMIDNRETRFITATLPKSINIESVNDLTECLRLMKLTEMFRESNDFVKIVRSERTKVGPVLYQSEIRHDWNNDYPSCADSNVTVSNKTFNADNRPFVILTVLEDENPLVLSMGRYIL